MIKYGYHGTNTNIEVFDLKHLGSQQGQSVFPGIYFTSSYEEAIYYANLAVEKSGGKPMVYLAECTLDKPLKGKEKFFPSFRDILDFTKKYFNNSNWFDSTGNLHSYKRGYLLEKQETYTGNYNFIKFAAKENNLETSEIIETEFGIDSKLDGGSDFAIISPQQINWFVEVDHNLSAEEITGLKETLPAEESLETQSQANYLAAFETKSNDYIRAARHGKNYKTMPGNRFLRRVKIKTNGGNNIWFDLDVNRLFKKGSFNLKIPVIGETAEYVCQISFDDWLPKLKDDILKTGFTQMTIKRSLMEMLRFHDLKVNCSCDDFKYRHKFWLSVHREIEGDPEIRPSDKTNPKDDLGKICKHLSMVMNNKIYGDKVSRIIYNYFINLKKSQKMLFDKMVAPKLGLDELDRRAEEARIKQEEALKKQEEEELKMNGVEEPISEEEKKKAIDEIDNINSGDDK